MLRLPYVNGDEWLTYSEEYLWRIFDKTDGYCYHCGKKLSWRNYGNINGKAGWEVDHSIPKSRGGTDHLNNLVPSCIRCNREKNDLTSKEYRTLNERDAKKSHDDSVSALFIIGGILLFLGWANKKKQDSRMNSYYS